MDEFAARWTLDGLNGFARNVKEGIIDLWWFVRSDEHDDARMYARWFWVDVYLACKHLSEATRNFRYLIGKAIADVGWKIAG